MANNDSDTGMSGTSTDSPEGAQTVKRFAAQVEVSRGDNCWRKVASRLMTRSINAIAWKL